MSHHPQGKSALQKCLHCNRTGGASSSLSRRKFFCDAGAMALSATAAASFASPVRATAESKLIDVHHHVVPPFYLAENRSRIAASRGGQISPAWLEWTPQQALAEMDKHGVATAVLSFSSPGVWFGDVAAARDTARRCNTYASELSKAHPGRFGLFAALPLPDTEGSLREIEYALDALNADGIGLLTSYGDKWLGDADYDPVFTELNRRKAVVFVHPTTPNCCRTLLPNVAPLIAEVPQDTTRAVTNLLFAGAFGRFKDIRFIFSHAGGTLPMVAGRMASNGPKDLAEKVPNGIEYELRRLYYDIAGTAYQPAIAAITSLVPMSQILFGSDHPFVPLSETANGMKGLRLTAAELQAIGRDNAMTLLPRLKTL